MARFFNTIRMLVSIELTRSTNTSVEWCQGGGSGVGEVVPPG